jgi:dihydropteroate synthase
VIEWADHFEISTAVKRKDEVARSETRMNSPVLKSCTQAGTDSLNDIDQVVVVSYIRDMV